MGRPAGDRLTANVRREVCQRTGSKAMVTGSIVGLGSQYVIGLKAVNCNTGDELGEALEQAAGKESVLKALDAAAFKMRSKLGESLNSPHRSTAIAALCQELNRTNSEFPGTHLRLHFEVTEQAIL